MAYWTRALVVGISKYLRNPLRCPVLDAAAVSSKLQEKAGCQVTLCLDTTRAQLQAAVDKFCSELLPGDHIIFFFAGHGEIQHSTHKHHLVCKEDEADQGFTVKTEDTDDRDSQQTTAATGSSLSKVGLATQDILMKIGAAVGRTGAVVALLDTCRAVTHRCSTSSSGRNTVADTAASESVVLAMLTKEDLDIHILLIELLTQQKELQQLLQTGSSTAASKLLAGKYTPKLLCHACGHGQVAYEGAGLDNGWYTHCLLKHLFDPKYPTLLAGIGAANTYYVDRFQQGLPEMSIVLGDLTPFEKPLVMSTGPAALTSTDGKVSSQQTISSPAAAPCTPPTSGSCGSSNLGIIAGGYQAASSTSGLSAVSMTPAQAQNSKAGGWKTTQQITLSGPAAPATPNKAANSNVSSSSSSKPTVPKDQWPNIRVDFTKGARLIVELHSAVTPAGISAACGSIAPLQGWSSVSQYVAVTGGANIMGDKAAFWRVVWASIAPKFCPGIKVLDLSMAALGDAGLEVFTMAAVPYLSNLECLDISWNGITFAGIQTFAVKGAGHLPQLMQLHINNNQIDDAGMETLAVHAAPEWRRMWDLQLNGNLGTDTGAELLRQAAKKYWPKADPTKTAANAVPKKPVDSTAGSNVAPLGMAAASVAPAATSSRPCAIQHVNQTTSHSMHAAGTAVAVRAINPTPSINPDGKSVTIADMKQWAVDCNLNNDVQFLRLVNNNKKARKSEWVEYVKSKLAQLHAHW